MKLHYLATHFPILEHFPDFQLGIYYLSNHLPAHRFVKVQPRKSRFTLNSGLDLVVRLGKKALAVIALSPHQLE